jgi:hypothetical protein
MMGYDRGRRRVRYLSVARLSANSMSMNLRHSAALALVGLYLMLPPVLTASSANAEQPTPAEWPALSGSDIDEWANSLRPNKVTRVEWANTVRQYELTRVGITYNKHDEAVALAIGKAMKQAEWPDPALVAVEGPVSTGIADSRFSEQASSALQGLFEKQFSLRPEVREYIVRDGFIHLYIGHFSPQRKVE